MTVLRQMPVPLTLLFALTLTACASTDPPPLRRATTPPPVRRTAPPDPHAKALAYSDAVWGWATKLNDACSKAVWTLERMARMNPTKADPDQVTRAHVKGGETLRDIKTDETRVVRPADPQAKAVQKAYVAFRVHIADVLQKMGPAIKTIFASYSDRDVRYQKYSGDDGEDENYEVDWEQKDLFGKLKAALCSYVKKHGVKKGQKRYTVCVAPKPVRIH